MNGSVVSISKDVMGGTPVFAGTRVPIQTLIDFLTAGDTIDDFVDGFPTVSREQVIEYLEQAEAQNGESRGARMEVMYGDNDNISHKRSG